MVMIMIMMMMIMMIINNSGGDDDDNGDDHTQCISLMVVLMVHVVGCDNNSDRILYIYVTTI